MSDNGSSASNVLVAFMLGAMAGAALALLYAPAPGDETRRRLAEKAREGRDRAEKLAREGRERAEKLAREGREFIERRREDLSAAIERGREAFDQSRKEQL